MNIFFSLCYRTKSIRYSLFWLNCNWSDNERIRKRVVIYCCTEKTVYLSSATACVEFILHNKGIEQTDEVVTTCAYSTMASKICHVDAKLMMTNTTFDDLEMDYNKLSESIIPHVKVFTSVDLGGIICNYILLRRNSKIVLSDNGTISKESLSLNFRELGVREAHECPAAMEEASVMMIGLNPERVMQGLTQLQSQKTGEECDFRLVSDYSMPNVSDKVVRIIISYIKRVVWGG